MRRSKPNAADAAESLNWQILRMAPWIPLPVLEYRFCERMYRFDLCWPEQKIAVEIDGGIWKKGGGAHTGTGHIRDLRKGNEAVLNGYRVLHFIPEDVVVGDRIVTTALDTIVAMFDTLGYKKE